MWNRVTAHMRDNADNPVGLVDTNPILDTQSYIVDFADGNQAKLTANLIAETILFIKFIDHRRLNNAIEHSDQMLIRPDSRTYLKTFHHRLATMLPMEGYLIFHFGTDFNFGTDLPQTVDETLDLDLTNGNTLWAARIAMEIKTSRVALQPMSPYLFGTRKSLVIWYLTSPLMTLPIQPT
ncbi:hypothetical protein ACHAXA_004956 [Cyclostephanos tholiformis]|uniref:Uncharacterized protein n=1 Tax=Cyclostephanos tholiformis TaxID=382380 RepID=A0ABD3RS40_9STRA